MDQGNLMSETAQVHTQWKNNLLLKKIVTLRYSTRTTSSTVQSTRRTSTSTFQDYHILQWNNPMAPTFKIWFKRSRTTFIDMHFKAIFNNVNNSIPSAKNQKTWFVKLGTSNCANYSMWNPKHSAKYVCRTGTSASSTARAGTSCEMEQRRTRNSSSTLSISSRFPISTSRKGDPTGTVTGRSRGITSTSPRIRSRRNARRDISWVFTTGSSVMRSSARTWLTLGRSEEICREMDKLANEDHTHHITPDEIRVYRNNWWIRSNFVGSDTMPVRHRADFKQAITTLRQLKNQEDQAYYRKWQSSSSSWWNWQESWWHSSSEHHRDDGPSSDRSGKPAKTVIGPIIRGMILRINLVQNYSSKFGNSQQHYHRRGV